MVALTGSTIDYSQPVAALAAQSAPADESAAKQAAADSAGLLDASRDAFKRKDYLMALTLDLTAQGDFTWTFAKAEKVTKLEGSFSINGKGLLVLASSNSQMIGTVTLDDDQHLRFILAGGPDDDPGMLFAKKQ